MRADANVADGDTPLAALMRETAAATVDTILAELRAARLCTPSGCPCRTPPRTRATPNNSSAIREARHRAEERPVQSQCSTLQAQRR